MKDVSVFGQEINRTSAVTQVLKTMISKPITRGFRDHYAPFKSFMDGNKLMRRSTATQTLYAYVNVKTREYIRVPHWLMKTICDYESVTYVIGPWVFINGFENTPEGKYLCKIFPYYFCMTEMTKKKVHGILHQYSWWVRIHKVYVKGMSDARINKTVPIERNRR